MHHKAPRTGCARGCARRQPVRVVAGAQETHRENGHPVRTRSHEKLVKTGAIILNPFRSLGHPKLPSAPPLNPTRLTVRKSFEIATPALLVRFVRIVFSTVLKVHRVQLIWWFAFSRTFVDVLCYVYSTATACLLLLQKYVFRRLIRLQYCVRVARYARIRVWVPIRVLTKQIPD